MKAVECSIHDLKILQPKVFGDSRGFFMESYNRKELAQSIGVDVEFVQDNHSRSAKNVLRGLHYQVQYPQGKLIRVVNGEIYDVAVDMRKSSPTYGQWAGFTLSADSMEILWIPVGFAHGFLVMSDSADVLYKTTDYYHPDSEQCIRWDDPDLAIQWPLKGAPGISAKDQAGKRFKDAVAYP